MKEKLLVLMLSSLVLLPGCALLDSLFGTSEEQERAKRAERVEEQMEAVENLVEGMTVIPEEDLTGEVIISMDGKPIVTTDSLEYEKEKLIEANPQVKQMLAFMDASELDRSLAEGLMNQAMVDRYIEDSGVSEKTAYKKELREGFKAVERMVNTKFFTQNFDIRISDSDARKFYEDNKNNMPNLVENQGGVKAMGVLFDTEQEARSFASQVVAQRGDIQKASEAQNMKDRVRDFMLVHDQSLGIDAELKDKIVAITRFPSTEVFIMSDNTAWVISAINKEEATYRSFETVKDAIKESLKQEEQTKYFEKETNALKERYNVKISPSFFGSSEE